MEVQGSYNEERKAYEKVVGHCKSLRDDIRSKGRSGEERYDMEALNVIRLRNLNVGLR